ncbi:hypothetical protein JIN86_08710 [Lysinibacillus sp. HST-98]|uniref:hypothetical protein n=1 Tax=Lysinibacillus sp. HST-98 TaxID=2800419 RepID=UPI0019285787|nr:hypothetical protein [Lysinibacillus sp. HST-98]MBL3729682.1 hypothetical protein [Lysinibacillus sp. HST-98]
MRKKTHEENMEEVKAVLAFEGVELSPEFEELILMEAKGEITTSQMHQKAMAILELDNGNVQSTIKIKAKLKKHNQEF